jgi:hypothetical protein
LLPRPSSLLGHQQGSLGQLGAAGDMQTASQKPVSCSWGARDSGLESEDLRSVRPSSETDFPGAEAQPNFSGTHSSTDAGGPKGGSRYHAARLPQLGDLEKRGGPPKKHPIDERQIEGEHIKLPEEEGAPEFAEARREMNYLRPPVPRFAIKGWWFTSTMNEGGKKALLRKIESNCDGDPHITASDHPASRSGSSDPRGTGSVGSGSSPSSGY